MTQSSSCTLQNITTYFNPSTLFRSIKSRVAISGDYFFVVTIKNK